jgi:ABC-type antimicrobial peptide transport system permease subunit
MTAWQYIRVSLRQYRRVHLAVGAGVAVAAAVITGALLVGDSMRGSLRDLVLRGLGRVDAVVLAEHPFRTDLVRELADAAPLRADYQDIQPLLLTQGVATRQTEFGAVRRATGLSVYGVAEEFWSLAPPDPSGKPRPPSKRWPHLAVRRGNEIALTRDVAGELGADVGDFVVLRIPLPGATPSDSALGEKEDASASRRLKVATVLDEGEIDNLARFGLRPSQQAPRNAFVPIETLQNMLELDEQVNAIALATAAADQAASTEVEAEALKALRPALPDYGLTVEGVTNGRAEAPAYIRISADRLVVPPHAVDAAQVLFLNAGLQPVVTYLANTISAGDRKIPYSTVVGVDSTRELGPLRDESGAPLVLAENEIALNDWAANDLGVKVGDQVTLRFYDPETTHGVLREHEPLTLTLRSIISLVDADGRPTAAADPKFAPELPGVTDQESIDSWQLPFELVEEVRDKDEEYWDEHRTTPKAFVSHALAARLWSTRWGTESVLRVPVGDGRTADGVAVTLREHLKPSEMGMSLLSVKRQALAAASGTTPFDGLFLGFSFFLMASALMLTALLFRLGVEQRTREVGLLLATGSSAQRVRRLLTTEALVVAAAGAVVGSLAGIAYAAVMVHGLNTWWVDATAEPFLRLHITPRSIAIGFAAGLAVAMATIGWSLRGLSRLSTRQLLAGDHQPPLNFKQATRISSLVLPLACLFGAIGLGIAGARWEGEAQAGAFFGGGALALVGALAAVRGRLREPATRAPARLSLDNLAARNIRRNPSRTMLALALAATASFLIVALSAFRLAPTDRGTGGFDLLATADLPLHFDLNAPAGREQLGFAEDSSVQLADSRIVSFRVHDGEDASCLNLYQTTQPRVLGAPPALADLSRFQWAMAAPPDPSGPLPPEGRSGEGGETESPWRLLEANLGNDAGDRPIVPMVLDRNTAFYSLKLYALGDQLTIRDSLDRPVTLQIVGMLANSILQGDVIVSEANFLRLFPETAGRRYFLIRRGANAPQAADLVALLETRLEDFGFDAVDARERLAALLAVQNTYLSTFQTLGGLGLLLGAVGLAVVQLRSVLERRGELALMQAAGFRRRRLTRMVLAENLALLLGGLAIGCTAALAAVLPQAVIEQVGAPWRTLALLLGIVALAGAGAAWLAARTALRAPLIPALRGE